MAQAPNSGYVTMNNVPVSRVAIAGATGYIGGRLAPRLIADGYQVRCLVRSPAKLSGRPWAGNPDVEIWQADLADAVSLAPKLAGCQAAFYLVHSMTSAGAEYADRDRELALQFESRTGSRPRPHHLFGRAG